MSAAPVRTVGRAGNAGLPSFARRFVLALTATLALFGATGAAAAVVVFEVKGAIGVASSMHLKAALEKARDENAALVVMKLDTPGGLVSSTREMIQAIVASPVPVAVYVSPGGAHAASAGTYLTYASHVAAMAPGTNLGAATPIQLGGVPGMPGRPGDEKDGKDAKKSGDDAMQRKVMNDAVAFIRGLAQMRGRNAKWAEQAVREAATLTATEAEKEKVIDFVARDLDELLAKADGRTVEAAGVQKKLATRNASVITVEPDWRIRTIGAIADPNVAFILLLIGIYGIIIEFWTPGLIGSGVIGAICLLLALAALSVLPVNFAGLALLLLGIALMVAEAFTAGFGVLGLGGLAAFVAGAVFLFDPAGADIVVRVAWPLVIAAAAASGALLMFVLGLAIRARRRKVVSGAEQMVGLTGSVTYWDGRQGSIRIHGEVWQAKSDAPLRPGDRVEVLAREGLTLLVRPANPQGESHA